MLARPQSANHRYGRPINARGRGTQVTTKGLREARRHWGEDGQRAARSRALLSLKEVRASGLPAFFFDHGEHLLYIDGELYDLRLSLIHI